jgi:hypothetical protein
VALHDGGQLADALAAFGQAVRIDPGNASAQFDRAQVLLRLGRLAEGWPAFEWRWKLNDRPPMPSYPTPLWDGKPLAGTLAGLARAGLRRRDPVDALHAGGAPPRAAHRARLQARAHPAVPGHAGRRRDRPCRHGGAAASGARADHEPGGPRDGLARGSAAGAAAQRAGGVARARLARITAQAGKRLKVGIIWSGSVTFKANAQRATALDRFLAFAEIAGVQLFSLQKGPRAEELLKSGARNYIVDLGRHCEDFADTAAAVDLLDLVIMTDSSVAHLAGALGKPIWNLLPFMPYWLYLDGRSDSPWYPSMRLFRQKTPGDWDGVFNEARFALAELARRHASG